MTILNIIYRFIINGDQEISFPLEIALPDLELALSPQAEYPSWVRLDYHRCPNCPLTEKTHPHCPLCVRIAPVIHSFEGVLSYDRILLEVISHERTIRQWTTVQRALGSLLGLIMAVSGCPHTAYFKPMARFHLPLASEEETIYRAASMYLLAQYFIHQDGDVYPTGLNGLKELYRNVQTVNAAIAERLRSITASDSSSNALIILDVLAKTAPYMIDESLGEIQYLFKEYQGEGREMADET